MEPNTLPPPLPDTAEKAEKIPDTPLNTEEKVTPQTSEIESRVVELPQASPQPSPLAGVQTHPVIAPTATGLPVAQPAPGIPAQHSDLAADDADLIEKEWVERAKHIIGQTTHDPHLQNKEINKIKAEYIKKRYNKDIKVQEA